MERLMKKNRSQKRKVVRLIVRLIILIAIITGIFFLVNYFIPVPDVTNDNIEVKLSSLAPTGKNITATVSSKEKEDLYYYIDYSKAEEDYYEDEEFSEEVEDISDEDTNKVSNNTVNQTLNSVSNNIVNQTSNSVSNNTVNNTSNLLSNTSNKLAVKNIENRNYKKVKDSKFEIENNGTVYLKYGRFGKLSSNPYVFEVTNIDKTGPEIGEIQTNTTSSTITVNVSAVDESESSLQYYFKLGANGSYISTGTKNSYTFKDLTADETYQIMVKVADKFGNESEAVTEATASNEQEEKVEKKIYYIKVNNSANTVTVYDKDEDGKYTKAIKAFICSTGKSTPKSGKYKISDRYRWRSLFGGVYGQYATRIHGNILFHSVPYEQMSANTLEYKEYDKLGTSASMGCVRLCVRDAKWIYDNVKSGSTVEFYSNSSNPGPLGKPTSQKISNNKENRNWDPTDPDKHNPWLGGDGKAEKTTIKKDSTTLVTAPTNKVTNSLTNSTTNTTNSVRNTTSTTVVNQPKEKKQEETTPNVPETPSTNTTEPNIPNNPVTNTTAPQEPDNPTNTTTPQEPVAPEPEPQPEPEPDPQEEPVTPVENTSTEAKPNQVSTIEE